VNAGDRARWLDPSPPIAVDGEEPGARKPAPRRLPRDRRAPTTAEPEPEPERGDEDESA